MFRKYKFHCTYIITLNFVDVILTRWFRITLSCYMFINPFCRWYGNSTLQELHPFFVILQLSSEWKPHGHLATFSNNTTALCSALCSLACSLSDFTAAEELLNFATTIFPCFSSQHELVLLTLTKLRFTRHRSSGAPTRPEADIIRTISESTFTSLTSHEVSGEEEGDVFISPHEHKAEVLYSSASHDLPSCPDQAIETLLTLLLHCKQYHLLHYQVKCNILLCEAQMLLQLYEQALITIESVFVLALSSTDQVTRSTARWLYVQAKLATCPQTDRFTVFKGVELHLKDALDAFLAVSDVRYVKQVLYYLARIYDEFGMRDDRNKCAKKFRHFHNNLTLLDVV